MSNLDDLLTQQAELAQRHEDIVARAEADNAPADSWKDEADEALNSLAVVAARVDRERSLVEATSQPVSGGGGPATNAEAPSAQTSDVSDSRKLFAAVNAARGGATTEDQAILQSSGLQVFNAASGTTGAAGGYSVPDEAFVTLVEDQVDEAGFLNDVGTITTPHGRPIPRVQMEVDTQYATYVGAGASVGTGADRVVRAPVSDTVLKLSAGQLSLEHELTEDSVWEWFSIIRQTQDARLVRTMQRDVATGAGGTTAIEGFLTNVDVPSVNTAAAGVVDLDDIDGLIKGNHIASAYAAGQPLYASRELWAQLEGERNTDGDPRLTSNWVDGTGLRFRGRDVQIKDVGLSDTTGTTGDIPLLFGNLGEAYQLRHVAGVRLAREYDGATDTYVLNALKRLSGYVKRPGAIATLKYT